MLGAIGRPLWPACTPHVKGIPPMGKGNNSQRNEKKNKKPKQDKSKPAVKK
jgi:hypothetical protein